MTEAAELPPAPKAAEVIFGERLPEAVRYALLGDQVQQDMTVLFSDVRDFTKISER